MHLFLVASCYVRSKHAPSSDARIPVCSVLAPIVSKARSFKLFNSPQTWATRRSAPSCPGVGHETTINTWVLYPLLLQSAFGRRTWLSIWSFCFVAMAAKRDGSVPSNNHINNHTGRRGARILWTTIHLGIRLKPTGFFEVRSPSHLNYLTISPHLRSTSARQKHTWLPNRDTKVIPDASVFSQFSSSIYEASKPALAKILHHSFGGLFTTPRIQTKGPTIMKIAASAKSKELPRTRSFNVALLAVQMPKGTCS